MWAPLRIQLMNRCYQLNEGMMNESDGKRQHRKNLGTKKKCNEEDDPISIVFLTDKF